MGLNIKGRLVVTIVSIFIASTACMGFLTYRSQIQQLHESLKDDLAKNQKRLFYNLIAVDAEGLARAQAGLARLEPLLKPFAERDRSRLLEATTPLFSQLKENNSITHMYFILPDGTVFLRAHRPEQFGDRLTRATFKKAVETGKTASGIEIGANFFSLRSVAPVLYRGTLIGYLEVAEEIDSVFSEMKAINGTDTSVLLRKEYLAEHRIRTDNGKVGPFTMIYPTNRQVSHELAERSRWMMPEAFQRYMVSIVDLKGSKYVIGMGRIEDAAGTVAGLLFSYRDVSPLFSDMWKGIFSTTLTFIAIFLVSSLLLYLSMRKSLHLFSKLQQDIVAVTTTSDLSNRLEIDTRDEIGQLAADFNRMKEQIERLQENLALRAEELTTANRELEAFNYTVSHDLRKPLTVINGYCQAIIEIYGSSLTENCKGYVNEIYNATLNMNQLIDALLTFSATARRELNLETIDLSLISATVARELKLTEPGRVARFEIAEAMTCRGDRKLLQLVMENLLGNAWKYTGKRKEAVIWVGRKEIAGERTFFVSDNGVGFDMAEADKLFAPLERLHSADDFKGHGIGLATVARIVQRHGGRIWAESQPDNGATFYFTINPSDSGSTVA